MNREERQVAVSPVLAGSENFGIDLMRKGFVFSPSSLLRIRAVIQPDIVLNVL